MKKAVYKWNKLQDNYFSIGLTCKIDNTYASNILHNIKVEQDDEKWKRHGIKGGKITLQYLIVQRLQNERKPSFSTFITSTISNSYKQVRKRASFAL